MDIKEPITTYDKNIASVYIYLTLILDDLEFDSLTFKRIPVKINEPYISLLDATIKKVLRDIKMVKQIMKELNIKVVFPTEKENDIFWYFEYFVRGYKSEFYFWEAALNNYKNKLLNIYLFTSDIPIDRIKKN
ncbi:MULTISPECIES: hypothetical protein [Metabacillus]|uniref:hypothetical protein n=1 Tax=Metabacillus TaxID=2675233 RepID=UPI000C7FD397|nr:MULTISPECIES: hypothetical protein [Metabacillus]MCM3443623.1 hypothetical protein [Metabacillus halosaccharovorans]PMC34219.1 hypothetical protein CJ195_24175 [Bacillus sp. UMB0899]